MADDENVPNLTKAAVILMSLGKDLAAEVMKYLSESEGKITVATGGEDVLV